MILGTDHINYLKRVALGQIKLWFSPDRKVQLYVSSDWKASREVNQIVAAQVKALGLTHVVYSNSNMEIHLTPSGQQMLLDEDEAWG